MWDVLSWGGETQLLVYDPKAKEVFGLWFLRTIACSTAFVLAAPVAGRRER